jgi:hypothetical protein
VGVFLWEALAGRHPFSSFSPLETARRVAAGAPSLATLRPDLPRRLTDAVDAMLSPAPGRRPAARVGAVRLRAAWSERGERPRATMSRTRLAERAGPAALAGVYAGSAAWLLPFFPPGWPFLIAACAAVAGLASSTAALGLALAVPILPLGNVSLGLALLYAAFALAWFLLFAGDPRRGLLFLLGPALAPAQALALVPVLVISVRGAVRRALLAAAAVPAATAAAALTAEPLPFTGGEAPASLGLAASARPAEALDALVGFLTGHRPLWVEGAALVAATVAAPYALRRGIWGAAAWGTGFIAVALLAPAGAVSAFPTVLWVWAGALFLAVPVLGMRR